MKKVSDIMVKKIVSISGDAPIRDAAKTTIEKGVGSLAVTDDGVTVGIVTDKDLVRYLASGKNAEYIRDIMSSPLIKVDSDVDILETFKVMTEKKISHIFVEEKKSVAGLELVGIIGMVSLKDVLRHLPEYASRR
jgi:CBS domain-containing protein